MAGSIYTYVGNTSPASGTAAIEVSQGTVPIGQSGFFLPLEVADAEGEGCILVLGPYQSPASQLVAPLVGTTGSGVLTGLYRYFITFVTAAGETIAGPESAQVSMSAQQGSISGIPVGSSLSGVLARKIYRTAANGASGTERYVATLSDNATTTYVDDTTDGSLGALAPTSDLSFVPVNLSAFIFQHQPSGEYPLSSSGANYAQLGTDGTVGGPGGSPVNSSVGGGGGAQDAVPTAVVSGAQAVSAGQQVRLDISSVSAPCTLPTAPPNKTRCGVKVVKVSGTPGSTSATLTCGGSDVFNLPGGSTVLTFTASNQGAIVEYLAADATWTVQTTDTPLNTALGAAKLGTDGTVGGPSGSALAASVVSGAVTRSGTGAPASTLGNLGDSYIDPTAGELYGPKTLESTWAAFPATSIVETWPSTGAPDGNWTMPWYGGSATILTAGQLTSSTSAAIGGAEFTGEGQFTAQEIWTTIAETGGSSDYIDLFLCCGTSGGFYRCKFSPLGAYADLYNYSGTTLGINGSVSMAAGDMIGATCWGGVVSLYHCPASQLVGGVPPQGLTPVLTVADSTYTSGYTAVALSTQNIAIGSVATGQVSNTATQPSWGSGQSVPIGKYISVSAPTGVAVTDTANLAAAMTAAAAATSGGTGAKVLLGAGTYVTSATVTLPGYTVLEGLGHSISVIQAAPGLNAPVVQTAGFSTYTGGSANGPQGYQLRSLTIDGNKANQTARTPCFQSYGYNWLIDDVYMINGYQTGMYSEWGGPDNPMESWIRNSKIYNYGGTPGAVGLDWNGPHDSQFTNLIVATLDSTIEYFDATYGSTAINGTNVSVPAAGTSFTLATTSAAPVAQYPTTGGSFVVPLATSVLSPSVSPSIEPTWTTITYTACSTTGSVTTFTGCTTATGTPTCSLYTGAGTYGIVIPSWGIRENQGSGTHGGGGEIFTATHVWGRNHFGMSAGSYYANCYFEGSILVNLFLGTAATFVGGVVLGTSGNSGHQPTEVGIQVGQVGGHTRSASVQGVTIQAFSNSTYAGYPISFTNDPNDSANLIQATCDPSPTNGVYCGQPFNGSMYVVLAYSLSTSANLIQVPTAGGTAQGSSVQVFTQQQATISNVSISGSTVTITTGTEIATLAVNSQVYVTGITGVSSTSGYTVSNVSSTTSSTTFSITQSGASWTSGGTITQYEFGWTKPSNSTTAQIVAIGGGGPGQSGGVQASGTAAVGGSGGGAGGFSNQILPAASLPASVAVNVANGGIGGPAVSTNSTAGTAGTTTGETSAFGGYVTATGGGSGTQLTGGGGGLGSTQAGGTGGVASGTGSGGQSPATTTGMVGAGASGGGVTTANVASTGGTGSFGGASATARGSSGAIATAGGNGGSSTADAGGGGGGGGGSAVSANGGAGGNGGNYGAGGGGGGAAQNGYTSGAGGNGAPGIVVVSTW